MALRQEVVKGTADAGFITLWIGTMVEYLPNATAILTFIWMCIRIWETETVRGFINKLRNWRSKDA